MTATHAPEPPKLYSLLAEFLTADELLAAARASYAAGYRRMDAYSPFPVEGLAEAIGFTHNRIPAVVLGGGLLGGLTGFFMQWYSAVIHYPLNVGGRPLNSWPSFIPITFELTVLFGAFAAVLGMLGLNGLPRPHHPVFAVPEFQRASRSRFFLSIQAHDPLFDREGTRRFLEGLKPKSISEVEF
jgi:hypothetical protein